MLLLLFGLNFAAWNVWNSGQPLEILFESYIIYSHFPIKHYTSLKPIELLLPIQLPLLSLSQPQQLLATSRDISSFNLPFRIISMIFNEKIIIIGKRTREKEFSHRRWELLLLLFIPEKMRQYYHDWHHAICNAKSLLLVWTLHYWLAFLLDEKELLCGKRIDRLLVSMVDAIWWCIWVMQLRLQTWCEAHFTCYFYGRYAPKTKRISWKDS